MVGDLTSAMFQGPADTSVPTLPATKVYLPLSGACAAYDQDTEAGGAAPSVPTKQTMPVQGGGSEPASNYLELTDAEAAIPDDQRTTLKLEYPGPKTTKSSYNKLAEQPA